MELRHERSQTKVIATIGPVCRNKETLRKMFIEGIDVCRMNFSHDSHDEHLKTINYIKELNAELNCNVAILADLQGPKLRIGKVENDEIFLEEGSKIDFVTSDCMGTAEKLYMSYELFPQDVEIGDSILIDDGKIKLEAIATNKKDTVTAKVIYGGTLSSKKGVNLPNTKISQPSLTKKDIADAKFALSHDVDWVALSFVRTAQDVQDLKDLINAEGKQAGVIAKIEKPEALDDIKAIIKKSDGIMIARGDLGVEVPFDKVPLIQKKIVRKCVKRGKPVIIATQMMESMITNFRPTRAEANDVGNAVLDGADAVMLSGETSVGKFPVDAIKSMQQIIDATEFQGFEYKHINVPSEKNDTFLPDSVCFTATQLSDNTDAAAIIVFTHSGYTAYQVSCHRPKAKIYAFTANKDIIRRLSLVWGVRAFYYDMEMNIVESIQYSIDFLKDQNLLKEGEVVIHIGSSPIREKGPTNTLKMSYVK